MTGSRLAPWSLAGALLAGPAASPLAAAETDVRALLDRLAEALGGREAISELRSLSVEADCTGPGGDFQTRLDSFRPDLTYFEQSFEEGEMQVWSTPERTWRATRDGGFEEMAPGMRSFLRAHEFHLVVFELEERFTDIRLANDPTTGEACRVLEMVDDAGLPASACLDPDSGLPIWLETNPEGAAGPVRVTYADWREVGELRFFSSFRLTEGPERVFTYDYRRIEPDAVSALSFVTPAPPSLRESQAAILEILEEDRRAHLATDASRLAAHLADSLVEVSDGRVRIQTSDEVLAFFETLFAGAEYEIWEDTAPPILRFASDASMAWVARTVRARRRDPASGATLDYSSAYTTTYERRDDGWRMTSVTSTFPPR